MQKNTICIVLTCISLAGCVTTGTQSPTPVLYEGTVTLVTHSSMIGKAEVSAWQKVVGVGALFAGIAAPNVGMAVANNGTLTSNAVGYFVGAKTGNVIKEAGRADGEKSVEDPSPNVDEKPAESPPRIPVIEVYVDLDNGKKAFLVKPGKEMEGIAEGDRVFVQLNKNGNAEAIRKLQ